MCHQTSTNPSWTGILPNFPPILWGGEEAGPQSGYTKDTQDFGSLLHPKCTFVPLKPWNVTAFPGMKRTATPSLVSVSWPHQVKPCAAALLF